MPKCEIFDLLFYRLINPICVGDLGTGKYFVNLEDGCRTVIFLCHFVFFTLHARKSRVSFENSFHAKQPMRLSCAASGRVYSIASFATPDYFTADCATLQRDNTKIRNRNIPRKGIERPQSQFPLSCVCERFVYSHERSAYSILL